MLLGQQNGKPRQATRTLLQENDAAREWAATVREGLEDVGTVPEVPAAAASTDADDAATAAEPAKPAPRPRPVRTRPVAASEPEGAAAVSSSRLGGAILIGGAVLAIVVVVLVLFVFGGDNSSGDKPSASASAKATATATPSATPQQVGQIVLKGVNGSKSQGVMTLSASQGQLAFAIAGRQRAEEQEQRGLRRLVHDARRQLAAASASRSP